MSERLCAFITGTGEVVAKKAALPELPLNEVRIEVRASLISPGTEMGAVRRLREKNDPEFKDFAFGYAVSGVVREINGDAKGLKVGDRVAAMGTGAHHCTIVNVPVNLVVPLPKEVSFAEGTFACLGATALQAVRRAAPQLGDYELVLGGGIVGNLAAQLSALSGARVLVWESLPGRRAVAARCNLSHSADPTEADASEKAAAFAAPYGFDSSIFAFGAPATEAFETVKKLMKKSGDGHEIGNIVLVGGCRLEIGGGAYSGNLNILAASRTGAGYHDSAWEHGRDYPNGFIQYTTQRNLREVLRLIAEKRLHVTPMITHTLPLREVGRAADLLVNTPDQAMGVILTMED